MSNCLLIILSWLCFEKKTTLTQYLEQTHRHVQKVGRVFANGPGDHGSIPGGVIPKT